jgi:hypothetical protein
MDAEDEKDWSADFLSMTEQRDEQSKMQEKKAEDKRVKDSSPTLPLEDYLGVYHCEMYGDAKVWMEGEQMMVHLEPTEIFVGHLSHWQYNTWKVEMKKVPSIPSGLVNFIIDDSGAVVEMEIDIPNPDFDFTELKFYKVKE